MGRMTKALGVLAGLDMPDSLLQKWALSADLALAADAGAHRLLSVGVPPSVIVGDFDSLHQGMVSEVLAEMIHLPDQESTDCDKLLQHAQSIKLEQITLIAVEGDRLDHMLATIHSAAKAEIGVRLALRDGIGWILKAGEERVFKTRPGRRVSLLPITTIESVSFQGVEWPLEKSALSPLGPTSISNRTTGDKVSVHMLDGAAVLFLEIPEEELPQW